MRKFLSVITGLVLLVAAAFVFWTAHGPQQTEERVTGGRLHTQAELAASGDLQLGTVVDIETGTGPAVIGMQTQFGTDAAADLQQQDSAEIAAAPASVFEVEGAISDVTLTSEVVLDDETEVSVAPLDTSGLPTADGQGGQQLSTSGYEQRLVELEWPGEFQVGRAGSMRVKLRVLADGSLQPVAEVADNEVVATPILITDRFDTHSATVTADISAPDFEIDTTSQETQQLTRGSEPEWRWTLKADDSGSAVISLGLTLSWQPLSDTVASAPANVPIWGQTIQVDVNHVFGLITVPQASILGTVLAIVGFVGEVPLLSMVLESVVESLFKRRRKDEEDTQETKPRKQR